MPPRPTGWATAFRSARSFPTTASAARRSRPFLMLDYAAPRHFEPAAAPARRRRAPAPRLRDGHDRLRGRARAPRLGGQRRPHRPGRRAVDDGGLRHPARGVPLGRASPARAARCRWCSSGSTCRRATRWRSRATRRSSTPQIPRVDARRRRRARSASSRANTTGSEGPAETFTPMEVWDLRVADGKRRDA